MLSETNCPKWTAIFAEGSRAITDWQVGSKVFFVNAEGDGMVSKIAEHIPNEYISIHHLGFYKNGVEDYDSEEAKKWGDVFENYKLSTKDSKSLLSVEMDTTEEYKAILKKNGLWLWKRLRNWQKVRKNIKNYVISNAESNLTTCKINI